MFFMAPLKSQGVAYHNKGAGHHQQCGDDGVQHPRHGQWQRYEIIRKGPDKVLPDDGKTSRGACNQGVDEPEIVVQDGNAGALKGNGGGVASTIK